MLEQVYYQGRTQICVHINVMSEAKPKLCLSANNQRLAEIPVDCENGEQLFTFIQDCFRAAWHHEGTPLSLQDLMVIIGLMMRPFVKYD